MLVQPMSRQGNDKCNPAVSCYSPRMGKVLDFNYFAPCYGGANNVNPLSFLARLLKQSIFGILCNGQDFKISLQFADDTLVIPTNSYYHDLYLIGRAWVSGASGPSRGTRGWPSRREGKKYWATGSATGSMTFHILSQIISV